MQPPLISIRNRLTDKLAARGEALRERFGLCPMSALLQEEPSDLL
jgi:hypothetical protein